MGAQYVLRRGSLLYFCKITPTFPYNLLKIFVKFNEVFPQFLKRGARKSFLKILAVP